MRPAARPICCVPVLCCGCATVVCLHRRALGVRTSAARPFVVFVCPRWLHGPLFSGVLQQTHQVDPASRHLDALSRRCDFPAVLWSYARKAKHTFHHRHTPDTTHVSWRPGDRRSSLYGKLAFSVFIVFRAGVRPFSVRLACFAMRLPCLHLKPAIQTLIITRTNVMAVRRG